MAEYKEWYKSKTIWLNIVTLIATILAYYGINIPPEMYAQIVTVILIVINVINTALRFEKNKKVIV